MLAIAGVLAQPVIAEQDAQLLVVEGQVIDNLEVAEIRSLATNVTGAYGLMLVGNEYLSPPIPTDSGSDISTRERTVIWGSAFGESPRILIEPAGSPNPVFGLRDVRLTGDFAIPSVTAEDEFRIVASTQMLATQTYPGIVDLDRRVFLTGMYTYTSVDGVLGPPAFMAFEGMFAPSLPEYGMVQGRWGVVGNVHATSGGTAYCLATLGSDPERVDLTGVFVGAVGGSSLQAKLVSGQVLLNHDAPIDLLGLRDVHMSDSGATVGAVVVVGGTPAVVWNGAVGVLGGTKLLAGEQCTLPGAVPGEVWVDFFQIRAPAASHFAVSASLLTSGGVTRGALVVDGEIRFRSGDVVGGTVLWGASPIWIDMNASGDVLHAWGDGSGGQVVMLNDQIVFQTGSELVVEQSGSPLSIGDFQQVLSPATVSLSNRDADGSVDVLAAVRFVDGTSVERQCALIQPVSSGGSASCPADFDDNGEVDVLDLLAFLALWFVQDPSVDLDVDGVVGVLDLLLFLEDWFVACR